MNNLPKTRAVTRNHFHNSELLRLLAELRVIEAPDSAKEFAENLGQWVGFAEAITLHGIHSAAQGHALGAQPPWPATSSDAATVLGDELRRVQAKLTTIILKKSGQIEDVNHYAPCRQSHLACQRDMEAQVRQLRAKVREIVALASPALKHLATLDAAFDAILLEREKKLLSTLPALMERRFQSLRTAHHDQQNQPPTWLPGFCHALQTVLLAELDLRLQPTLGLIEAFNDQTTQNA